MGGRLGLNSIPLHHQHLCGAWPEPTATLLAKVIHQNDLLQEGPGRRAQDAVHSPQEGGPVLVVEAEDDAGRRQAVPWVLLQTPARKRSRRREGPPDALHLSLPLQQGSPPSSTALSLGFLTISISRDPILPVAIHLARPIPQFPGVTCLLHPAASQDSCPSL